MNTLLFIGHPGHELLAYKFLIEFRPSVIFLTTGSGNKDQPRIQGSIDLLTSLGLNVFKPFEPFTDKEIYDLIMRGDFERCSSVKEDLKEFVRENNIQRIVGDALEGFNPSHDLCRYLINSLVDDLSDEHPIASFDFLQDEIFKNSANKAANDDIVLHLNTTEMENKLSACLKYSALKFEVDRFFDEYGADFFRLEHFRRITNNKVVKTWEGSMPFYESHGRKRVDEGTYEQTLLFEDHMKPIAHFLLGIDA